MKLGRKKIRYGLILLSLAIALTFVTCRQATNELDFSASESNLNPASKVNPELEILSKETGVLTVWWYEGYVEAEQTYLEKIVEDWEQENNKKIKLVFMSESDLLTAIEDAVASGNTPDITVDRTQLATRLAWQGKLADVSAIMEPIADSFPDSVIKNAYQYNDVTKQKSYYAVPIQQEGIYLHYWRDLLEQAGYRESDIPQSWNEFWQFWQTVQQKLQSPEEEIFSFGFTTSPFSTDTFLFFEQVLEAYNVKILDETGKLIVARPENRQGIITALRWWANLYQKKYIPPSALFWENADNNSSFYNRIVAIVPNPTLSIPAVRAEEKDVYLQQIGTVPYPLKPNGEPMRYLTRIRQALVFADRNLDDARSFLSYLIRPDIIANYIEAAGGRFFPVNKANLDDPFWNNPQDPHIYTVKNMLAESPTRPHYFSDNPAYMEVFAENIWGKALERIITEGISPEDAANWAIYRIKQIFSQWQ